jgi:hypothetical protein
MGSFDSRPLSRPTVGIEQTGTGNDVDVVSSALPTGAATSANQATANSSLSSIDGKITACNTSGLALESGGNLAGIKADADFLIKQFSYAKGTETSAGTKTLIAAVANKKHILKSLFVVNNDSQDGKVAIQENGASKDIFGDVYISAFGGQFYFQWQGYGESQATANKAIELVITTATALSWKVEYYDV